MKKRQRKETTNTHIPYGPYEAYVKRPMDIALSVMALLLLWPLMAVTACLVKKKLGSPVLFSQHRPGRNGTIFCLYKFRTMTDETDDFNQTGKNRVEFLISTNVSKDLAPLVKTASGGEISRVMLAIKTIFSSVDKVSLIR